MGRATRAPSRALSSCTLFLKGKPFVPSFRRDYVPLANLIGIIFQIRDDYVNLQSVEVRLSFSEPPLSLECVRRGLILVAFVLGKPQYANNKGFCEDFSEGKFSFPIVHAIRADQSNRQILSENRPCLSSQLHELMHRPFFSFEFADILRQRPSSPGPKTYAVSYMNQKTNSFAYTRQVLRSLTQQAFAEVARLGGNAGVEAILKKLEVEEPSEEAERGLEEALGRLRTQSSEGGPAIVDQINEMNSPATTTTTTTTATKSLKINGIKLTNGANGVH